MTQEQDGVEAETTNGYPEQQPASEGDVAAAEAQADELESKGDSADKADRSD